MQRTQSRPRRKLVCPSCKAAIRFRPEKDDLGICPRCGEWLTEHGRWHRHLESLTSEADTGADEYESWETNLEKRLN